MVQVRKTFTGSLTAVLAIALLLGGCSKEEVVEEIEVVRPVKIMTVQAGVATFSSI